MESQAYTFSNELDNPSINYIQCIIKAYVENFWSKIYGIAKNVVIICKTINTLVLLNIDITTYISCRCNNKVQIIKIYVTYLLVLGCIDNYCILNLNNH